MSANGYGRTQNPKIKPLTEFHYAEEYHQDYLVKNPNGFWALTIPLAWF
ncbi:MAG: hypothetical protein Ct9H300mP3_09260 [Gammaproteobacteria bacterium]|nr:MAG: hypothetical protein Ct9H300mP3_09260 [Gammaproteobacteria bacterium]